MIQNLPNKNHICSFTGPRPKKLAGYRADYRPFVQELAGFLEQMIQKESSIHTFLSGGAQGFDMLAFWAVDILKQRCGHIRNILVLPYITQADAWSPKGAFSKEEWNAMRKCADKEIIVSGPPSGRQQAVNALLNRNSVMIENSAYTVALYPVDDHFTPETAQGGTGDAIRKAIEARNKTFVLGYDTADTIRLNSQLFIL